MLKPEAVKHKKDKKKENESDDETIQTPLEESNEEEESNKENSPKVKKKSKRISNKSKKGKEEKNEEGDNNIDEINEEEETEVKKVKQKKIKKKPKPKQTEKDAKKNKKKPKLDSDEEQPAPTVDEDDSESHKNNDELSKKLKEVNDIIIRTSAFIDDNIVKILTTDGQEEIKKLIKMFKNKYYPYKNILRFAIPVIGTISSGKSTILNYLLRLKKTLESAQEITTKCICIIRHKKGNKKARIYEVNIIRRGEENDGLYNFEKGEEIKENVAKVIAERNKIIAENKVGNNYEKYFLIIEYEIPFFLGEMEKYADVFEFMDVPGLNEISDQNFSQNKNNNPSFTYGFYFRQIFPLIKNNIKFSLFIFDVQNYGKSNSKDILHAYLDKKYDNDNYSENQYNNYSNSEELKYKNVDITLKKEKQEQRNYCSFESFKNSIFVLNKIDLVENKEEINQEFKDYIEKEFTEKKYIKLDEENEIPLTGKKLNDEISKYDSFGDYIKYYNSNSKDQEDHSKFFYRYITNIMKKEFKMKENDFYSDEESEHEEDEENEEDEEDEGNNDNIDKIKKPSNMDEKVFKKFVELKGLVESNNEFKSFLKPKEYDKLSKLFEENKNKRKKKNEKGKLEKILSDKMKKIIDEYFDIDKYSSMQPKIIADFKIDINSNNKKIIQKKLQDMMKNGKGIANPKLAVQDLKNFINRIYNISPSNRTIIETSNECDLIINYLDKTSAIRFLLVGPHNSGKSSFLNRAIGYNQKLLPTKTQECTKIGVIIKYIKKGETPKLYETNFKVNKNGYNYFEYNEYNIIATGQEAIYKKKKN